MKESRPGLCPCETTVECTDVSGRLSHQVGGLIHDSSTSPIELANLDAALSPSWLSV